MLMMPLFIVCVACPQEDRDVVQHQHQQDQDVDEDVDQHKLIETTWCIYLDEIGTDIRL